MSIQDAIRAGEPHACSRCGTLHRCRHLYCAACHAESMREWRKTHRLAGEARRRDYARSYANVYKRIGKITLQPCEVCGVEDVEMHHDDYSRPLDVRFLCRTHHLALHGKQPSLPL